MRTSHVNPDQDCSETLLTQQQFTKNSFLGYDGISKPPFIDAQAVLFRYLVREMQKTPGFRQRNGLAGTNWRVSDFHVHLYLNKKGLKGALWRLRRAGRATDAQQPESGQIQLLWETFGSADGQWSMEDTGSVPESADKRLADERSLVVC
jgi:hypothetical protein